MEIGTMTTRLRSTLVPTALLIALTASPVLAFGGGKPMPIDFAATDANGDGKLTAEELKASHDARVKAMDADGDGFISAAEIEANMLAQMKPRLEKMARMRVAAQDTDNDGKLSLQEASEMPRADQMFARMDADGDGAISKDELAKAMERMGGHGTWRHKKGDGPNMDGDDMGDMQ
jgi:hypothetical protein